MINGDIFIRTVCLTLSFAFFYSQSATEGSLVLAVNVILLQFVNWMSYGIDGFAFAAESLVGKHTGARQVKKLHQAVRLTFVWGMGLAALISIAYWCFGTPLLRIFTNQQHVIDAGIPYLIWIILFPLLATPCYLWDGIFIGLTASRDMRNSMLISLLLFLGAYYVLRGYGNHGLWLALLLFMVFRGIILGWMYRRAAASATSV